jgi:tetratricopeptide (TPR) repeat protein
VDSYRQAVRLNQRHYQSMLNLASCYEQQQRFSQAVTWYEFALLVNPMSDDAHYGIALCCVKDGLPDKAYKHIEESLKIVTDAKELLNEKIHLTYMKALCLKLLRQYRQSERTYISLQKSFNREEGNKIAKYIFGMILMPLETNRKKIMQYVEGFQGILEQYEADNVDRRKLIQYSIEGLDDMNRYIAIDNKDKKWLDKDKATVLRRLRSLSFFSRFSLDRQREILYKMNLKMQPKNTLLFFEANHVYVIVSGSILMKNHERNIMLP